MPIEIERKFLVQGEDWKQGEGTHFAQGYLNHDKARAVRVRIAGTQAFLTIKGIGDEVGLSRVEFEYEIPLADAQQLLALCEGTVIEKIRRVIPYQGFNWEVDEFFGENQGLVIAEIELDSVDQPFEKPSWVCEEVTNDPRYFNLSLVSFPYCKWGN